jgi:Icc-related predicted phosphoesterase
MKINIISDLHLEFSDLTLPGGDVLILSGDVMEAKNFKRDLYKTPKFMADHPDLASILVESNRPDCRIDRYYRFFKEECSKYREVVYVMGNHEHYRFQYQKTWAHIAEQLPDNVTLLENQTHTIDDVVFVGATLWTDMNNADPLTMFHMKGSMNDYKQITQFNEAKNVYHRLDPERTVSDHYKSKQFIKETVEADPTRKYVVVTHHAPTKASIKPRYAGDTLMNGAYSSDLSDLILDNPQIKLWTHGHTHDVFDYMVGSTRVICNPRGYQNYEERANLFRANEFEIEL